LDTDRTRRELNAGEEKRLADERGNLKENKKYRSTTISGGYAILAGKKSRRSDVHGNKK